MLDLILLYLSAPAAALCLFLFFKSYCARMVKRSWDRQDFLKLIFVLFVISVLVMSFPPYFRVLSDETDFLNTAWSLLESGKSGGAQEWVWEGSRLHPLRDYPSFRPALFPFVISVFGLFLGTHYWIPFVVNLLVLFFFLSAAALSNGWLAFFSMSLHPVLLTAAFSGGYDLFALVFLFASLFFWSRFQLSKEQKDLHLAAISALCLANTRTEGLLLCAFLFLPMVKGRWKLGSVFFLFPLLPPLLLRLRFPEHVDVPEGEALFSFSRLPENFSIFLRMFFLPRGWLFPLALHWLGLFSIWASRKNWKRYALPCSYLLIYFLFLMGFHGGKADAPTQTRLFLPFSCFLIWMALEWVKAQRKILKMGLGILLLASSLFSLWISRSYLEEFPHPMTAQFKALREILSRSEGVKLFVYANPGLITAFGQAAIQPWRYMRDEVWQRQEGKLAWVESWPTMAPSLSRPEWLVPENLKEELYYAKLQSLRLWERPEKGAWKKD